MTATTYTLDLPWGETLRMSADLSQASAPIQYEGAERDEWMSTPYQTADARHDETRAMRLVLEYLGREYYAAPDDERDDDDIISACLAAGVEEESE